MLFWFVFVDGLSFQMRGALLPSLQRSFHVEPALLGLVATAGTIGFIGSVFIVGMYAGRLPTRISLLASIGVVVMSMLSMAVAPVFGTYLVGLFVRGVATGPVRALDRSLLSHLYPDGRTRMFTLYALMWAVGATLGPLVVTGALALGNWRFAYVAFAFAIIPLLAVLWQADVPRFISDEQELTLSDLRTVLRKPAVSGMTVALVLSGGVEGSLFTWLPYFATRQFDESVANLMLSTFLVAYVPARFIYSAFADRLRAIDLVVIVAVGTLATLSLTTFILRGPLLFVGVFAMGWFVSGIFPTLSALGVDAAPGFSAPINSIATSASYTGIATMPAIVGLLANTYSIQVGLQTLVIPMSVCLIVVLMIRREITRASEIGVPAD
ncbi:MFS transporter [Haladaptatus sp. NG-SE-30]